MIDDSGLIGKRNSEHIQIDLDAVSETEAHDVLAAMMLELHISTFGAGAKAISQLKMATLQRTIGR